MEAFAGLDVACQSLSRCVATTTASTAIADSNGMEHQIDLSSHRKPQKSQIKWYWANSQPQKPWQKTKQGFETASQTNTPSCPHLPGALEATEGGLKAFEVQQRQLLQNTQSGNILEEVEKNAKDPVKSVFVPKFCGLFLTIGIYTGCSAAPKPCICGIYSNVCLPTLQAPLINFKTSH